MWLVQQMNMNLDSVAIVGYLYNSLQIYDKKGTFLILHEFSWQNI